MPIVTRDDGTDFAVYTYRELLSAKSGSLLRQEIQLLQQDNGDYARFFQQPDGDYEAVFAKERGYLLGETIWEHFEQPSELIYCEALPSGENAILIVVRGSQVYLDAELPIVNLPDEFSSLVSGESQYDIYVYGDVPLAEKASDDAFAFDAENIKSFTVLEEPVFPAVDVYEEYELIPVAEAIEELDLGKGRLPFYIAAIVAAIGLGYLVFDIMKPPPPPEPTVAVKPVAPAAVYADYKSALKSPSPTKLLVEFALNVQQMYTMPGWEPISVKLEGSNYLVNLKSVGGSTDILLAWIRETHSNLQVQGNSATISIPSKAEARQAPTKIYDERDLVSMLYDRMKQIVPSGTVNLGAAATKNNFVEVPLTVSFSGISTDILMLFAKELRGLPTVLETCNASIRDGLLNGSFSILILGAKTNGTA